MSDFENEFDVIVVGAGASGGVIACVLAERGKRVLVLERGKGYAVGEVSRDHLRNHRLSQYGHNTGPELEGHPRVATDGRVVMPHDGAYGNNAMAVGGGTLVYGAQAWRFLPKDFRMASEYGVPEGSSLADWPVGYEEMAKWYERAEWGLGVCGSAHEGCGARGRDYPMGPLGDSLARVTLRRGAEKLGWAVAPPPLAINSVPYLGRPACTRCGHCVGFACHVDAKNGSQNTMLPRAMRTGLCEVVTQVFVEKILVDGKGRASGVSYFVDGAVPVRKRARAKAVVVCAGAVESARLLLMSACEKFPRGLGNDFDQVGRNLQGHYYPGAHGYFKEAARDSLGPGVSIATCRFNHGNAGIVGGGMLADEFVKLPIIFWKRSLPPGLSRWGQANKDFMREGYMRTLQVQGPVQEIPSAEGRVMLDGAVRDKFGLPVVRFSGTQHEETVRTSLFMRDRAEEWLRASGAEKIWSGGVGLHLSGGQHQAGTCRMGNDVRSSVTDAFGKVHGVENVFVSDGGLHVTNGGFNPFLTIMALAFRNGERIAGSF